MDKHEEFIDMLYERAKSIDEEIDRTGEGSDEEKNCIDNLASIAGVLNANKQLEIDEEDKEAKREEQKRVNEFEMEIKKAQVVNESNRLEMDRESRKNQIKLDFARIGQESLANFARIMLWGRFTSVAMREEYGLNGTHTLPIGIQRAIDRTPPKKM